MTSSRQLYPTIQQDPIQSRIFTQRRRMGNTATYAMLLHAQCRCMRSNSACATPLQLVNPSTEKQNRTSLRPKCLPKTAHGLRYNRKSQNNALLADCCGGGLLRLWTGAPPSTPLDRGGFCTWYPRYRPVENRPFESEQLVCSQNTSRAAWLDTKTPHQNPQNWIPRSRRFYLPSNLSHPSRTEHSSQRSAELPTVEQPRSPSRSPSHYRTQARCQDRRGRTGTEVRRAADGGQRARRQA